MSERLLLRLGSSAEHPVYWLHWDDAQRQVLDQGQLGALSDLSQLTPLAIRIPCYALVSNAAVLTTEVQLPNNSRAAREAIPYQLEEQLCEEIEKLHFATAEAVAPGRYPVAVVARSLMDLWQQGLLTAGLPIQKLCVDAQSIALVSAQLQQLQLLDQTLIRGPEGESFSFSSDQAESWLTLAENQLGQNAVALDKTAATEPPVNTGLTTLAERFDPDTAIDLLQGNYKLRDPVKQLLRAWKLPAVLLCLMMALEGGQLLWQQQQLKQQKQQLEQQISALFSATLPGSRKVNPAAQLDNELKQLAQRNRGSEFLGLLQKSLPGFTQDPSLSIQDLAYQAQAQSLILELETDSHAGLERLIETLSQQGLAAQIQRSRQQNGQVSAQISIKEAL